MNPNFEKYIRKTLSDQEEYIDAEAIWQEVEPHVRPEKKRRKFFWWFFFGTIAGLVAAGSFWNLEVLEKSVSSTEVIRIDEEHSSQKTSEASVKSETAGFYNQPGDTRRASSTITNKVNSKETKEIKSAYALKNENQNSNLRKPVLGAKVEVLSETKASKNIKQNTEENPGKIFNDKSTGSRLSKNESVKPNLSKAKTQTKKTAGSESIGNTKATAAGPLVLSTLNSDRFLNPIPKNRSLITPVHQQRRWHYAIGVYSGIGFVRDKFSPNGIENVLPLTEREQTETQLESFSLGLSFTAKYKSNWSLRTGLEYHRIARRLNYEETQITFDTVANAVLATYINNATGDRFYETGTIENSTTQIFEKENFNYFHRLDVPLLLGFTSNGKRFRFGLEAGAYVNVLLDRKGQTLSDATQATFYDLAKDEQNWYKTNLGITPVIQGNMNFYITPRVEIHASPYYRFNTTYTSSESSIRERYSDVGVQLGMRFWLR